MERRCNNATHEVEERLAKARRDATSAKEETASKDIKIQVRLLLVKDEAYVLKASNHLCQMAVLQAERGA